MRNLKYALLVIGISNTVAVAIFSTLYRLFDLLPIFDGTKEHIWLAVIPLIILIGREDIKTIAEFNSLKPVDQA